MTDINALIEQLTGESAHLARQQLIALRATAEMTTLLRETRDPALKRSALYILEHSADPAAIPALVRELATHQASYRTNLIWALDAFDLTQTPDDLGFVVEALQMEGGVKVAAEAWRFGPRLLSLLARTARPDEAWLLAVESILNRYPGATSGPIVAALERMEPSPRVSALREVLEVRDGKNADVLSKLPALAAIQAVAARGLHQGLPTILKALEDPPNLDAELDAIITLARPQDEEAVLGAMLSLLEKEPLDCGGVDYRQRVDSPAAKIIHLLAIYPGPRSIRALVRLHELLTGDGCADERHDIEVALMEMGATHVDTIFDAWEAELGQVPDYGLEVLELMAPVETLLERLDRPRAFGRAAAAHVLARLGFEPARDPLAHMLAHATDPALRRAALDALVLMKAKAEVFLDALTTEPDAAMQRALLEAVGELGTNAHFEELHVLLNVQKLRRSACLALLKIIRRHPIGAREGQIVNSARHDPDLIVRLQASALMMEIGLGGTRQTTEAMLVRLRDYQLGDEGHRLGLHRLKREGDPAILREVVATPGAPCQDAALVTLAALGEGAPVMDAFMATNIQHRQWLLLELIDGLEDGDAYFLKLLERADSAEHRARLLPYIQRRHITAAIPVLEAHRHEFEVAVTLAALGDRLALKYVVSRIRKATSQQARRQMALQLGTALSDPVLMSAAHQIEHHVLIPNWAEVGQASEMYRQANRPLFEALDRLEQAR